MSSFQKVLDILGTFTCAHFSFILILFLISLFAHVKFRNIAAPPTLNESSWSLFIICVFSFYLPPALPDLVIDTAELQKSIIQEYRTLYDLRCAHEESCLSKSADALFKYESTLLQKQRSITSLGPSHLASWLHSTCYRWVTSRKIQPRQFF